MKLRIQQRTLEIWVNLLRKAGTKETGGILFGEHVDNDEFRLLEITKQRRKGDEVSFRRKPREAKRSLKKLRAAYDNDHTRFNYLGEWHSHPNAPAIPSRLDGETMQGLLADPKSDAHFLVLIIVRLNERDELELSANAFLASGHILECEVIIEPDTKEKLK